MIRALAMSLVVTFAVVAVDVQYANAGAAEQSMTALPATDIFENKKKKRATHSCNNWR